MLYFIGWAVFLALCILSVVITHVMGNRSQRKPVAAVPDDVDASEFGEEDAMEAEEEVGELEAAPGEFDAVEAPADEFEAFEEEFK